MADINKTLFVWRAKFSSWRTRDNGKDEYGGDLLPPLYAKRHLNCPFCSSDYVKVDSPIKRCKTCGFYFSVDVGDTFGEGSNWEYENEHIATLREFSLLSSELTLNELGTHLNRKKSDISCIPPRRFEELMADVYRNAGFSVRLTQQTRDGDVDLYLMDNGVEKEIVECRRYTSRKAVSVGVVRSLLGVQLAKGITRATIVATTRFTGPCIGLAREISSGPSGYQVSLRDASELLASVDCYNVDLPPLHLEPRLWLDRLTNGCS